jgi:hypothetical protein
MTVKERVALLVSKLRGSFTTQNVINLYEQTYKEVVLEESVQAAMRELVLDGKVVIEDATIHFKWKPATLDIPNPEDFRKVPPTDRRY